MITNKDLFQNMDQTIAGELFEQTTYPWEVLPLIHDFILKIGPTLSKEDFKEIHENVWVAKSATIARTAEINGPCIIGADTEVRPGAFIRGNALIGEHCVVGNSTEIKNDILFNNVQVPHYNYVGDSILGYKSHMGAGSITSNVKSDKTNVVIKYENNKIETGMKKIGAILGDEVEVGCGSILNPGSIIGGYTNIYPLSMVRGYIKDHSIYKNAGEIAQKN
ncbi:MAG: UDP-N-acetylglucosamine pyrophosphorylase [Anaerostipes sp.]|nr:UDP-N-acetylglucosamine pyrophosphorylase [Anaerostipes sp.]